MKKQRILYLQFTDPAVYPPIAHSAILLARRGWDILLLGVGGGELEMPVHPRLCLKRIGFFGGGYRQKLRYLAYFFWALWWTCRWRPKWLYASDPLACPLVWWLTKLTNVNVLYHEHDSPIDTQPATWFMRQVMAYRRRIAVEVKICVLPQEERLRSFKRSTGRTKSTYCVWNVPRLDELAVPKSCKTSDASNELILYYHGSITPDRLPKNLIVAASRLKGAVRLWIVGYEPLGGVGYLAELTDLAIKVGRKSMIKQFGTLDRTNLFSLASSAHVGLSLVPPQSTDINLSNMVGASNKPFDYMACGLPLLVTNLSEWIFTFVEPGYGISCNPEDPYSIEAALQWFLDHPIERVQMGQKAQQKIRDGWNYDTLYADVVASLEHD